MVCPRSAALAAFSQAGKAAKDPGGRRQLISSESRFTDSESPWDWDPHGLYGQKKRIVIQIKQ